MADGGASETISRTRPRRVGDLFCGAGGLSTGAKRALRKLRMPFELVGVNHWPTAIETNRRNHPEHAARIHCADLETVRPLDVVPEGFLDLLMAAPSCVFHSRARGGRPVHDQQRMDPWHVVRWCTELRVARILIENVPEFMDWGPCDIRTGRPIKSRKSEYFRAWVAALEAIGFRVQYRVLCAADYGDPTTRRRFFLIGCSDRRPLNWPEPTHAPTAESDLVSARAQWRGAAEIIDWSRQGTSIFNRKRPLAANTLRRIRAGAVRYGWPQVYVEALDALLEGREPELDVQMLDAVDHVRAHADTGEAAPIVVHFRGTSAHAIENTARSADHPLPTLTTGGHVGIVMATGAGGVARDLGQPLPTITASGDGGARPHFVTPLLMGTHSGQRARATNEPAPTITTGGAGGKRQGNARPQLIEPLIVSKHGGPHNTARGTSEPMFTVSTSGGGSVAQPLIINRCTSEWGGGARSIDEPVPTIATSGGGFVAEPLVGPYYGNGSGKTSKPVTAPLPTVSTVAGLGLAEPLIVSTSNSSSPGVPRAASSPLCTITTAKGGDMAIAAPFLVPNFGERAGQDPRTHDIDVPLPTVAATGHIQLAEPVLLRAAHGDSDGRDPASRVLDPDVPLPAATGSNEFSIAAPIATHIRIDIHYRMLHWRELARAMSFDDDGEVYDFAGTATEITKQIGNAVPGRLAAALVRALMGDAR